MVPHNPNFNYGHPEKDAFLKYSWIWRKYWEPAFSPFLTMSSTHFKKGFCFQLTFILSSAKAFNLDKPKICSYCKGLEC